MKSIKKQYRDHFSEQNLNRIFEEIISFSGGTGIDNINQYAFRAQLGKQIPILSRKMLAGSYDFTKYKLSLLSKGRGKPPREISIPTIRDRISLRAMCDFLQERFQGSIHFELPQSVVKQIKNDIGQGDYSGFIKLDVSDFYPSIDHALLEKQLDKRLRKHPDIKAVIFSAVKSPTVVASKKSDELSKKGVPQGLSISNILAAIYMQDLDKYLMGIEGATAFRYVDDVLILCDYDNSTELSERVIDKFSAYSLNVHSPITMPNKSKIGRIEDGFDYLGYDFKGTDVSVRSGSIEKLKASLVGLFTSYKYSKAQSAEFLMWRLDLRITGCIFENKSKGWLFFFSEINDEGLLHRLDHFVTKLCKRFDVDINPKKFVRAFKEISHQKYVTKYVPNFDEYTIEQKGETLVKYFNYNLAHMQPDEINHAFHKKVHKQIKDLESDIKDFSVSG